MKQRGQMITDTKWAPALMATYHPSALLRMPDEAAREKGYAEFVDDLKKVARAMKTLVKRESRVARARPAKQEPSDIHPTLFGNDPGHPSRVRHA